MIQVKQFVKQLKNASVQTEAMSESDADSQLETLIAVVNRRVDEWKVMLMKRFKVCVTVALRITGNAAKSRDVCGERLP